MRRGSACVVARTATDALAEVGGRAAEAFAATLADGAAGSTLDATLGVGGGAGEATGAGAFVIAEIHPRRSRRQTNAATSRNGTSAAIRQRPLGRARIGSGSATALGTLPEAPAR